MVFCRIGSRLPVVAFTACRLLLSAYNQPIDTQLEMEASGMAECARSEEALQAMSRLVNKS